MTTVINNEAPVYSRAGLESLNPEDLETASIRSAAPSYTSDAPSYHTVAPHPDPVPPYTPPASSTTSLAASRSSTSLVSSLLGPEPPSESARRRGLPPVPSGPIRHHEPSLNQFRIPRIPTWSRLGSNPNARQYYNVANRRATSNTSTSTSSNSSSEVDLLRRGILDRIEEDEHNQQQQPPPRNRIHALEDPILVGEEAARRARQSRLARERADDILIRENLSWDWFLGELSRRHRRR